MGFREVGNEGFTNDTTQVEVVPAPRKAGVRHVLRDITVYNPNGGASEEILVSVKKDGTDHVFFHQTLGTDATAHNDETIVLDATDESVVIELESSATNQIHWVVAYAEIDDTE